MTADDASVAARRRATHRRRRVTRQIRRRTGAAMQIGSAAAVRRGAILQAHVYGAVAVVAEICGRKEGGGKYVFFSTTE